MYMYVYLCIMRRTHGSRFHSAGFDDDYYYNAAAAAALTAIICDTEPPTDFFVFGNRYEIITEIRVTTYGTYCDIVRGTRVVLCTYRTKGV